MEMEKQIYELLLQMQKEQKDFREEMKSFKDDTMLSFDKIESLLSGVANQFEVASKNKDEDIAGISKRLSNIESDVYRIMKH